MKEWIRRQLKRAVRRVGHRLPYEAYLNRCAFAYHLAKLFKLHGVRVVIDVGAHRGGYGCFLRDEVGFRGRIHSFEPAGENLACLRALANADPRWQVHDIALGSTETARDLNIMQASVLNSFFQPDTDSVPDFAPHNQVIRREKVRVRRLDSVLPGLLSDDDWSGVYLKVDTQGFDFEVLQGAIGVLDRICGIQTEASVRPLYHGSVPYQRVLAYLEGRGFEVTGMYPVARDEQLRLIEFDLVMTRCR